MPESSSPFANIVTPLEFSLLKRKLPNTPEKTKLPAADHVMDMDHGVSGQFAPPSLQLKTSAPSFTPSPTPVTQLKITTSSLNADLQGQAKPSFSPDIQGTPLPTQMKENAEKLAGVSMQDVRVVQNSRQPAQFQAEAFAQGTNIHLAPGKQEHLGHEAWHVVQQKQGRVQPTTQLKGGLSINDDASLEQEADTMGAKLTSSNRQENSQPTETTKGESTTDTAQMKLEAGVEFLTTDGAGGYFLGLKTLVDRYNELCDMEQGLRVIDTRFTVLREIDRSIYRWFDRVTQEHAKLSDHPQGDNMKNLMVQADQEYINLVDETKNNADVLPMDTTGMDGVEVEQLKALWRSVVAGDGKIKMIGSAPVNKKTLGHLAKIMNTETGRRLIHYLNTPLEGQEDSEMTNIYIGDDVERLPEAVREGSPDVKNIDHAEAQVFGDNDSQHKIGEGSEDLSDTDGYVDMAETTDYMEAVLTGKEGVVFDGKKHKFSEGRGSFVTNPGDSSVLTGGEDFHETIGPSHITLAHELGHSAHMKAGATTLNDRDHFMNTLGDFDGGMPSDVWDNTEEFINISNFENLIREESGMRTMRTGHRPSRNIRAQVLKNVPRFKELSRQRWQEQVLPRFNAVREQDPITYRMDTKRMNLIPRLSESFHMDEYFEMALENLAHIEAHITPATIRDFKRNLLIGEYGAATTAYNGAGFWAKRRKTVKNLKPTIDKAMTTDIEHFARPGNVVGFNTIREMMSDFIKALN